MVSAAITTAQSSSLLSGQEETAQIHAHPPMHEDMHSHLPCLQSLSDLSRLPPRGLHCVFPRLLEGSFVEVLLKLGRVHFKWKSLKYERVTCIIYYSSEHGDPLCSAGSPSDAENHWPALHVCLLAATQSGEASWSNSVRPLPLTRGSDT